MPAQQLHFDIIDSGIGISAPQIRKVFEPFAQADASASRKFGGTGLGLFLSKRFAKLIGGTLSVDSDYGHGSCFTLSIPTGVIPEHELLLEFTQTDSRPAPLHQPAKPDSLSGNILLAEDTKDNQLLIQAYLKGNNLQITTVEDGQQAIDAVTNKDFDLVLMDIQMPIMTGLQATKNLRARGVQTPIVALTANVLPEDCQNYLENGFNDVIGKPINREQLVEKITAYLTSPGVKELELIYSTLLSEGDDFLPAIEHFVQQTNSEREFLQTHLKNNDWPELEKQLHRLKGSGGSVGFSIVTKLATEAEEQLKAGHHTTAMATINTLSNTLTRLRIADAT